MNYILLGLNHKTAPIAVREKLAFDMEQAQNFLRAIKNQDFIQEIVPLSTCNRVEFYAVAKNPSQFQNQFNEFLIEFFKLNGTQILDHFYFFQGSDVVKHLFEVTASLDSQMVGENQITGQVKDFYQISQQNQNTGLFLNKLFHRAFSVAKRIKTETDIGRGNVSIGSAAVMLAKKIFGSLEDKVILFLGAGEIGELSVRYLNSQKVAKTYILNRTLQKAQDLASQGMGEARDLNEFLNLLQEADVLITSINGIYQELHKDTLEALMKKRLQSPLFIIDLGLPRNVPQNVAEIDNIYLYNIDDLKTITEQNKEERAQQFDVAQNIIAEEVSLFYAHGQALQAAPAILQLSRKFENIRQAELTKTLSKLSHLGEKEKDSIEKLTRVLVDKILQEPILSLKKTETENHSQMLNVLKKIFSLNDEE